MLIVPLELAWYTSTFCLVIHVWFSSTNIGLSNGHFPHLPLFPWITNGFSLGHYVVFDTDVISTVLLSLSDLEMFPYIHPSTFKLVMFIKLLRLDRYPIGIDACSCTFRLWFWFGTIVHFPEVLLW